MPVTLDQARAAKPAAKKVCEKFGTVLYVGITRKGKDFAVKVNIQHPPKPGSIIPEKVDGVPLIVAVVGDVTTFGDKE